MLLTAINAGIILDLIALHTFADFFLQTRWMAKNKSTSNKALALHVGFYGSVFIIPFGWRYAAANAVLHLIVDWITSRGTSYCHKMRTTSSPIEGDFWTYWFFAIIGVDQALHLVCLVLTIGLIR